MHVNSAIHYRNYLFWQYHYGSWNLKYNSSDMKTDNSGGELTINPKGEQLTD